jgi:hypothetical protein
MTLPANSTIVSFSDINTEIGKKSITSTISLSDTPVRLLAPGPGKTINTTAASTISVSDLASARVREYYATTTAAAITTVGYLTSAPGITNLATDTQGNIYAFYQNLNSAKPGTLIKLYPHPTIVQWARDINLNTKQSGSNNLVILLDLFTDSNDNVYCIVADSITVYSKYSSATTYYPVLVKFDSSGTFQWQSKNFPASAYSSYRGYATADGNIVVATTFTNTTLMYFNSSGTYLGAKDMSVSSAAANTISGLEMSGFGNYVYIPVTMYLSTSNTYYTGLAISNSTLGAQTVYYHANNTYTSVSVGKQSVDSTGNAYIISYLSGGATSFFVQKVSPTTGYVSSAQVTYTGANITPICVVADYADNINFATYGNSNATFNYVFSTDTAFTSKWNRYYQFANTSVGVYVANRSKLFTSRAFSTNSTYGATLIAATNNATGTTTGTFGSLVIGNTSLLTTVTSSPTSWTTMSSTSLVMTTNSSITAHTSNVTTSSNSTVTNTFFTTTNIT